MNPLATRIHHAVRDFLIACNYRVLQPDTILFYEPLLLRALRRHPDFFFVQIGANDGVFHDGLHEFATSHPVGGLVIEPSADFFAALVKTYRRHPRITPVRTAIHRSLKSVTLHRPDPARLPELGANAQGIGSLDWEHHRRAGVPDDCMVTETVPAMTLAELFQNYGVTRLDLLQIDTEGYDAEIVRMLADTPVRPALIRFEHGLADGIMTKAAFAACADFLIQRDYHLLMEPNDAIAYDRHLLD